MDDFAETMRRQVAEKPRVRFICERDWMVGPYDYVIGFLWKRNFDAQPGEFMYRRRLLWRIHLRFQLRTSFDHQ